MSYKEENELTVLLKAFATITEVQNKLKAAAFEKRVLGTSSGSV